MAGWLQTKYPQTDFFAHDNGHLLHTLLGFKGNAHFDPLHIVSNVLIFAGFILLSSAWKALHLAQRNHTVALSGIYRKIRHPQYIAFIIIMVGFLLQWPTIPTLVMFPILVYVYIRLARKEEKMALDEFGEAYANYMRTTPAFIPHL